MTTYDYITELVDLSAETMPAPGEKWVVMQSRPMNFANSQSKGIELLISRATVYNADHEYSAQIIAGSNDLKTWKVVSYIQKGGDFSNMKSRFPTGNYIHYIIMLAADCSDFELTQIDAEINLKFYNKLR